MTQAFSAADVRAAEEPLLAAERGFDGGLMHRAATALATAVRRELRARRGRVAGAAVVGLVGPGNNGGDTLHALALLARNGVQVCAVTTASAVHDGGLAALRAAGGRVLAVDPGAPGEQTWMGDAVATAFAADVVLDGLLGIGARGALRGPGARLAGLLGELVADVAPQRDPGPAGRTPLVVAVDVPSGIGVDDGSVPGPVLRADRTVTFGAVKPGLLLPPAGMLAGTVDVVDLGLRPVLRSQGRRPAVERLVAADVAAAWPVPDPEAHKYTRGVVGVVAGTDAYPGAAVLTVAGAQGAGCGMVRYVGPGRVADAVLAAHPEVVVGDGQVQAWVLGPGTDGTGPQADAVLRAVRAAAGRLPVVLDAGALDPVPLTDGGLLGPQVVLTPHAGELARLLVGWGEQVDRSAVEAEPLRWVRAVHERTGATVLLKGAVTLVVGPGGVLSQAEAPPWLATAGSGDVLAGMIGAVLAGRADDVRADPSLAARLAAAAVAVHGWAAHAANPGGPVTAGQVAAAVPQVVARVLRGDRP